MSIDQRLRGAFAAPDETWNVNRALDEVLAAAGRPQVNRRVVVACALAAAIAIVVAYGSGVGRDSALEPADPPPVTNSTAVPSALEGVWQTAPLTRADLRATLRAAGLEEHLPAMVADLPPLPLTLTVTVVDQSLTLRARGGSTSEVIDEETITAIEGDRLTIMPTSASGVNDYRWHIDGAGLHLEFLKTSEPVHFGVPAEAWQRLLYTSAPFST